jgi:hypothetical protein
MMFDVKKLGFLVVVTASLWGCGDDDDNGDNGATAGNGGTSNAGNGNQAGTGNRVGASDGGADKGGNGNAGSKNGGSTNGGTDAGSPPDPSGGGDPGAGGSGTDSVGGGGEAGGGAATRICPDLPAVLSLSGCDGIGPLCTVTQDDCSFSANCGGREFAGTLTAQGVYTMTPPNATDAEGTVTATSCLGELRAGKLVGQCTVSMTPTGGPLTSESCTLAFDPVIRAGVECLELPSVLEDLVICDGGAAAQGTTIEAGDCKVAQDGCSFQANCADDLVLTGTVSATGLSFRQSLKALADAQTPASGTPAFSKGDEVAHTCNGTVDGTTLTGTCGAGATGRGGVNTSVCPIGASVPAAAACGLLAPEAEALFVLDSCDLLKEGEEGTPGVGEPVCALRQNNCVWEVDCGGDNVFGGKLKPSATKAEWRLATGTPCEASFDAQGKMTGKCTVPGQAACLLSSKPAVPGGDDCVVLPEGTTFDSNGCGGGPLECRLALQHGCNFKSICSFTSRYPSLIFTGEVNKDGTAGRNRLEFNGIGDYDCYVEEATAEEVATDGRLPGEWYGQCENSQGGLCRNNYDPTTGSGFRGLRVYFGEPPVAP